MSIKKESGEILIYIYNNRKQGVSSLKIVDNTKKDLQTVNESLEYLQQKNLVELEAKTIDGNYHIVKITADGVDIIENNSEFQKTFSFGVNLGLFSANWSVTKK